MATLIGREPGFGGRLGWDKPKPNGQPRRRLDVTRARERFGFVASTSYAEGVRRTVAYYEENRAAIDAGNVGVETKGPVHASCK